VPGGRPSVVTRDRIARSALEIVDRDGLDALSMRGLADELGIGKMTLYGHVRDKGELLAAVVDAAVEDAELPPRPRGPWQEQIRALFEAAHANLTAHPALVQIRFSQPVLRPEALRFGEEGMAILEDAGFEPAEAARAFRLLFTFTFGFAGLSPEADGDRARRLTATAVAGLPEDEYPRLSSAGDEFARAVAGREQFIYGLGRIVDGLEARLGALAAG
jgi:AcrR family transcriptional regulator